MDADPGEHNKTAAEADNGIATTRDPNGPALWLAWWVEGARAALFRPPKWTLRSDPTTFLALMVATTAVGLLLEWAFVDGAATFYWQGLLYGWLGMCALAWVAWLVLPATSDDPSPTPAMLLTLLVACSVPLEMLGTLLSYAISRGTMHAPPAASRWLAWLGWFAPLVWWLAAVGAAIWRAARVGTPARMAAIVLVGIATAAQYMQPVPRWYATPAESGGSGKAGRRSIELRQEDFERSAAALDAGIANLAPQRPGRVDVYTIVYAPYEEAVFRRESGMVAEVVAQRFGAQDRVLQLVNQREPGTALPWATPQNLQRAIAAAAAVMNRDEDVLLLHLTSHGARDGALAQSFFPLESDALTPGMLRGWLDAAGVRYRVVSVSACYSGSWIAPMSSPETLVMTAADAEHTSFGCGSASELTYFGRAMFDEQLRNETRSFEQAHAQAREIIRRRELEAGKSDGYSNPQIATGTTIRAQLQRLVDELTAPAKP